MPALVGADGNGVSIFLDGGPHDVINAAVVTEMNDFRTLLPESGAA